MSYIPGTWLFLTLLIVATKQESPKDTINVRTVLFKEKDVLRQYWAADEMHLLAARKIIQDLLPRNLPSNFNNLAMYLKKCIEVAKKKLPPDESASVSLAVYDVVGGYLKSVVLPILNEAYYAGNVNYATAAELHSLYSKMACTLHTDGSTWAQPCDMRKIPTKVQALEIVLSNASESCEALEVRPRPSGLSVDRKETCRICVPYLDDNAYPGAVAIPLKGNSLFSLMCNGSSNLLPKFYILAMRCLSSEEFHKRDVINFNRQFYDWIISTVVPHLQESDRWYPGFGGVMRIVETMNQKGLTSNDILRPDVDPSQVEVPGVFSELEECDEEPPCCPEASNKGTIILIIVLVLLFLFLCCCCIVCIMKSCSKKQQPPMSEECQPECEDSGGTCANTLISMVGMIGTSKRPSNPTRREQTKECVQSAHTVKDSASTDNKTRSSRSTRSKSSRHVSVMQTSDHNQRYYSDTETSGSQLSQRSTDL